MKSDENEKEKRKKKRFLGKLRGKCKESARERELLETERVFLYIYIGRRREEEGEI